MHRTSKRLALFLIAAIPLGACSFVGLESEAQSIRVLESEAPDCEALGTTRVEVLEKIGFLFRNTQKVSDELDTLARNAALGLGGNAVAALGPIEAGTRRYRILRCP
ncbi:MAG: DUF4156 domain-containing protein [bacterium]|nr:DUF4156 domain-containing protein [bacterium]